MSAPTKLIAPKVIVLIESDEAGQLAEYTVQTDNRDAVQWDLTRSRRQWPKGSDAPMIWLTFLAWHALKRTGAISMDIDKFLGITVQVSAADAAGEKIPAGELTAEDLSPVDPTQPAAAAG